MWTGACNPSRRWHIGAARTAGPGRNVIVAGIRRDGRPHLSPNWFYWDGQRFYVSVGKLPDYKLPMTSERPSLRSGMLSARWTRPSEPSARC